ncbi:carbohydrate kinase [Xinfangfangia sp. D13-10-4-6]|uniref:FGGY-family carbohydrate kinase n=1 Tax=Pseudogemmobacter hezensis TaxID=2737662 RepID=UPI001553B2F4|nr:FGGY-family carbohydrate kinase [Pseudogemmobacter hezensis]NPD16321.1 carbohydrate kinase [Pseudogemmobacter hezensis]
MTAPAIAPAATALRHIAVIDIGKTNAKLALVEAETLQELAVVTRPNRVLQGPPYPHFDLAAHWDFFLTHLAAFHAQHGVDAISVTTHAASAVLLDAAGQLATPMLDYEHDGPDRLAADYDRIRPDFAETGSPRLPMGLNLGAQLYWLFQTRPRLLEQTAHVLTYPQYWGWRLTGELASDVTSLGCHTDLWNPWTGAFSSLAARLGITDRLAPARQPGEVLGRLLPQIAAQTGLSPQTPVSVGIHDSNASLYPHIQARQGIQGGAGAFSVVSTGTWVISMAVGAPRRDLDPGRDLLVNVNALGQPVPSARFMGGREYEIIRAGSGLQPTPEDRANVLTQGVMILPAAEPGSGPFQGRQMQWTSPPATEGQKLAALSFYLALMTETGLGLIGATGPTLVEGPFSRNPDYLDMLAALRPDGVAVSASVTGTSAGAAMLAFPAQEAAGSVSDTAQPRALPADHQALRAYAKAWRERVGD